MVFFKGMDGGLNSVRVSNYHQDGGLTSASLIPQMRKEGQLSEPGHLQPRWLWTILKLERRGNTHSRIEIIADKDPQPWSGYNAQWHQKHHHYRSLHVNSYWWLWDSLWAEEARWCGRKSALMHRLDGRWMGGRWGGGEASTPMGTCWSKTTVTVSSCENFHSHSVGVGA